VHSPEWPDPAFLAGVAICFPALSIGLNREKMGTELGDMNRSIKYSLSYRKQGERITLDQFDSVNDVLAYCQKEGIDDPVDICRVERQEERVLNRSQILKLLGIAE